ncbi:MAG TPA: DUF721 domain-containing protein [Gammaproteobacteria bacterium]
MPRPTSVATVLSSRLAELSAGAASDAALTRRLREALPAGLAPHLRAAHVDAGVLTLYADSAAWATRFRYAGAELLARDDVAATRCRVRILADEPRRVPESPSRPRPSAAAAGLLLDAAATSTPEIGDALRRLARALARRQTA